MLTGTTEQICQAARASSKMAAGHVDDLALHAERQVQLARHAEERRAAAEDLVRRAAPFVNAVAAIADDKTPALAWIADAAAAMAPPDG